MSSMEKVQVQSCRLKKKPATLILFSSSDSLKMYVKSWNNQAFGGFLSSKCFF